VKIYQGWGGDDYFEVARDTVKKREYRFKQLLENSVRTDLNLPREVVSTMLLARQSSGPVKTLVPGYTVTKEIEKKAVPESA